MKNVNPKQIVTSNKLTSAPNEVIFSGQGIHLGEISFTFHRADRAGM